MNLYSYVKKCISMLHTYSNVIILLNSTEINCTKLNKYKIIMTLECLTSNPLSILLKLEKSQKKKKCKNIFKKLGGLD